MEAFPGAFLDAVAQQFHAVQQETEAAQKLKKKSQHLHGKKCSTEARLSQGKNSFCLRFSAGAAGKIRVYCAAGGCYVRKTVRRRGKIVV